MNEQDFKHHVRVLEEAVKKANAEQRELMERAKAVTMDESKVKGSPADLAFMAAMEEMGVKFVDMTPDGSKDCGCADNPRGCGYETCPRWEPTTPVKTPEGEDFDAMVRDFTTVHPKTKAEVRRRLLAFRQCVLDEATEAIDEHLRDDQTYEFCDEAIAAIRSLVKKEV